MIGLDDWGFPVLIRRPVPPHLVAAARRAAAACPKLALALRQADAQVGSR